VIHVHDVVPGLERAQVLQERARAARAGGRPVRPLAENLLFRDEHETLGGGDGAARQRRNGDTHHTSDRAEHGRSAFRRLHHFYRHAAMPEQRRDAVGLRARPRGDRHPEPGFVPERDTLEQRVERRGLALARAGHFHGATQIGVVANHERRRVFRSGLESREQARALPARDRRAVYGEHWSRRESRCQRVQIDVEGLEWEMRSPAARRLARAPALYFLGQCAHDRRRVFHDDRHVFGDVVEQRDHRMERREVALDAEVGVPERDVVDQLPSLGRRVVDRVTQAAQRSAGTRLGLRVDARLARRRYPERFDCLERALILRIEAPHAHDHVSVELDAYRELGACRPHVEQPAAHRERARVLDHGRAKIAGARQELRGPLDVELTRGFHVHARTGQGARGHHTPNEARGRHHSEAPRQVLSHAEQSCRTRHARAAITVNLRVRSMFGSREIQRRELGARRRGQARREREALRQGRQVARHPARRVGVRHHHENVAGPPESERVGSERRRTALCVREVSNPWRLQRYVG